MKKIIFCSILFAIMLCNNISAQSPTLHLERYYPLNNTIIDELVGGWDGVIQGEASMYPDRYGRGNGAIKFSNNGFASIPSILSNFNYKQNGFTVSFWVCIEESIVKITGLRPWYETDPLVRAFFAKKGSETMLGFHRRRDRAIIDRYTYDVNQQMKSWGIWMWDPMNFTVRPGWYHVVISYEKGRASLNLFCPTGEIQRCAHYFGVQDMTDASLWGLGNNAGPAMILDDFKVYNRGVNEDEARNMHAQEAMPNGMYKIEHARDGNQLLHTSGHVAQSGGALEIYPQSQDFNAYKWVFSPVPNKINTSYIRMAYTNQYIRPQNGVIAASQRLEISDFIPGDPSFEWNVNPHSSVTGGGYYIRQNSNTNLYMHTVGNSSSSSTRIELQTFNAEVFNYYLWYPVLIKTQYEIKNGFIDDGAAYDVLLSDNTYAGMNIITPVSGSVINDRGSYPSLLTSWRFTRYVDDSYRLTNTSQFSYQLCSENYQIVESERLRAQIFQPKYFEYYNFIVKKPNKYGRRITISPAINSIFKVGVKSTHTREDLRLVSENSPSNIWAVYKSNLPNPVRQVYDLKPGIYRITSMADDKKSIATMNYSWSSSSNLALKTTSGSQYTNHFWVVDYERDSDGLPVMDGTYIIQLFATDTFVWHTKNHFIASSSIMEIFWLNRDELRTQKWYVRPTRTGDGAYTIQCAGDINQFVHLTGHTSSENNQIELYPYIESHANTYKWKFESVAVAAPFSSEIKKVVAQQNQSQYMHVMGHSTTNPYPLEIYAYRSDYDNFYRWDFIKNNDNTFLIRNVGSNLYVHIVDNQAVASKKLEQRTYDSNYAPYYKWIIVPGTRVGGTYTFRSVANPDLFIHLPNHTASQSNKVEIYPYVSSHPDSYEWRLQ